MLTVRASKKRRRFFLRRDVLLIRRRTQRRPRAAGTQSAHILLARSKKKIPSNETRVSSCLFYLRVVVSLRAYLLSADNNDERFFIVWFCAFPVRFFEKSIGFSLAENHRLRLTQRCTFLVERQPRKKKQTNAELKRRLLP
jgi:hypothetical protein